MNIDIGCFIFYFDILEVVENYIKDPGIIDKILAWQREVRDNFSFMEENTTCKTLNDNVWARITSRHPEPDMFTILDFAGKTMRLAENHGFKKYFGAITYGDHSYDLDDRTLSSGSDRTDITKQHIDSLSGPHIRAAFCEKWSAKLAKRKIHPCPNAIWVGEEALFGTGNLHEVATFSGTSRDFATVDLRIDLRDPAYAVDSQWPFNESGFQFIKA